MPTRSSRFLARLTRRPLDLYRALRLVGCAEDDAARSRTHPDTGAVVGFTGIIRRLEQGRPLRAIRYEEYRAMALREMNRILGEARTRWPLQAAVLLHRVGITPVGRPSVAVAVAASHRAPAFDAARFLIDALKERVPLWKNFLYGDAGEGHSGGRQKQRCPPEFLLAVPVQAPLQSPAAFVRRVRRAGGNAIELRADALVGREGLGPADIAALARQIHRADPRMVVILTPRAHAQGGVARLSVACRQEILTACLPEIDALDVELHSRLLLRWAAPRVRCAGKLLILSVHDFHVTPPLALLDRLLEQASDYPEALLKIAVATLGRSDLFRLIGWTRRRAAERPLAVMSMGESARVGRLLLAALGSRLAFATLDDRASAPGQISLAVFSRALRALRHRLRALPVAATRDALDSVCREAERLLSS